MSFLSSFYPQPVVAGTTEGTFAEGDDARITGAAQKSANLSDLVSASSARANLGLGTAATSNSGDFAAASHNHAASAINSGTLDIARIPTGTSSTTVAIGNDSRITGALPAATAGTGSVLASGSTTARTLSDRFGEVFHVEDYGAVGDWNGVTGTDDTAAIQSAINAAVAAGGGIVRFSPNKTYRLHARNQNTIGQTSVGNHLNIYNGTSSLRICIDGQGAKLYSSLPNGGGDNGTDIFYICTSFDTICFENLTFERSPYLWIYVGSANGGIRINPPLTPEPSKLVRVQNCKFIDCTMPFAVVGFNVTQYLNKLDRVEILDTMMIHPRGSSGARHDGGLQTINLSRWVNNSVYHNVFFNGAPQNGILPFDVDQPRDGFSFVGASHEVYSNCYFTGNHIETVIPSGANSVSNNITLASYVQPNYGNQVTWTIATNPYNNELTVGDVYIVDTNAGGHNDNGPVGVYRIDSFTGSFSGQAGQTVTVTRLQESEAEIDPKAIPISAGNTVSVGAYGIILYERDAASNRSLTVRGCQFIYDKSIETYPFDVTGNAATNTFTAKGPNGGTCTISNSNPAVVTKNNHGLIEGTKVFFTTTGSLPSGITENTIYHIRDVTSNTFTLCGLSTSQNVNTRIATTTDGSGVHTMNTAATIHQNSAVRFKNIIGGTNLVDGKTYYVINKALNSSLFQVSLTQNGSAVDITTNLTGGKISGFWRGGDPAIAGYCPSTITGNVFYGCKLGMFFKDQYNWGPTRGSTISGNYFVVYSDELDQVPNALGVASLTTDGCIFSNNQIILSKSKDFVYVIRVGANNCSITGNVITCLNTATVPLPTKFIQFNNGAPATGWKTLVENNIINGLDSYADINGVTYQPMGSFQGSILGNISSGGSPIKICSTLVSPDKSKWLVSVTNDGELEILK